MASTARDSIRPIPTKQRIRHRRPEQAIRRPAADEYFNACQAIRAISSIDRARAEIDRDAPGAGVIGRDIRAASAAIKRIRARASDQYVIIRATHQ